jgi:C-terminal processing protease CtpA/Prc
MTSRLSAATDSESKGIGIWVAQLFDADASDHRGALVVLEVILQSAAERAGLRAGDRIAQINGIPTHGMTLEEAVTKHLRAGAGTHLQLDLERTGGPVRANLQTE